MFGLYIRESLCQTVLRRLHTVPLTLVFEKQG